MSYLERFSRVYDILLEEGLSESDLFKIKLLSISKEVKEIQRLEELKNKHLKELLQENNLSDIDKYLISEAVNYEDVFEKIKSDYKVHSLELPELLK